MEGAEKTKPRNYAALRAENNKDQLFWTVLGSTGAAGKICGFLCAFAPLRDEQVLTFWFYLND